MAASSPASRLPAPARTVLLIDDDPGVLRVIGQLFERYGWTTHKASDGRSGIEAYERERPDLVILDLDMPDLNGTQVLTVLRSRYPEATVVMLSGQGDIDSAVECMQLGAESFLSKPLEPRHLAVTVERAYEKSVLRRLNRALATQQVKGTSLESLGTSPAMRDVARLIQTYADGVAPVLLTGETGSGKGWIAKILHASSGRRNAPFVSVNCAGLSATFLDSELFGHEKGAFTDAKTQKPGLFEVADGGTLLLDEVGDLAIELQPKLLTVLETRRFRRLGGTREIGVDVRLIAATHVDLAAAVRAGRFREDLYYRLAALPIRVPSLRERGADSVAALGCELLTALHQQLGRGPTRVSPDALKLIADHPWPGNVRELRNVLERALLTAGNDGELGPEHFPADLRQRVEVVPRSTDAGAEPRAGDLSLAAVERAHIARVLALASGNRTQAAKLLGVSRQGLYNRLSEYGLLND